MASLGTSLHFHFPAGLPDSGVSRFELNDRSRMISGSGLRRRR